jgi:hypothetical protein
MGRGTGMFCYFEKDEKNFRLTADVIGYIREKNASKLFEFDNKKQHEEIVKHLYLNRCGEDNQDEKVNWVRLYGKDYRKLLNTIKVAAMIWCYGKDGEEFTMDEFHKLADWLNGVSGCLENIHS